MTTVKAREPSIVRTAVVLLATVYAATFVVAVLLHAGVEVPLGFAVLEEPRRPFAVIVEGATGTVLAVGAFAALAQRLGVGDGDRGARRGPRRGAVGDGRRRCRPRTPHPAQRRLPPVMVVLLAATLILQQETGVLGDEGLDDGPVALGQGGQGAAPVVGVLAPLDRPGPTGLS